MGMVQSIVSVLLGLFTVYGYGLWLRAGAYSCVCYIVTSLCCVVFGSLFVVVTFCFSSVNLAWSAFQSVNPCGVSLR